MKEKNKRRAKPFPANKRSIKWMEEKGWSVAKVEQRLPHCMITKDAFGFGDLLACSPMRGVMLVQVTAGPSKSNFNSRIEKIKAEPMHAVWLASGGRIQVHNWMGKGNDRELQVLEITSEEQQ